MVYKVRTWCSGIPLAGAGHILGKMPGAIVYTLHLSLLCIEMWEYSTMKMHNIEVRVFS